VQAIAADFTTQPGVPLIRVSTARCRKGKTTVTLQQARFDADNSGQKPLKWRTPVALQVAGKPATTRRVVLSGRSTVTLAGCGAIKVNAGQRGYYRTQYDQAARTALEAAFKSLPPADQLGLLHDTWAFGATGVAPLADYMRLAGQAGPLANPVVTAQVAGGLRELGRLARGTPLEQPIALRARQILAPAFARIGWDVKPGEPANDAVLRETLIRTLAWHADPAVRAEAKRRMAAGELPGATRSATLHAALYGADVALYEATLKQADATSNPVEKRQLYGAISAALDPALAKRTLKMALDPSSGTLGPWLISSVARSHPDLAWVAVTENWGQLAEQLDPLQRYDFAASIAAFSPRAERATELEAFAAANLPADARKAAVEAAAAIRADATIRDRYLPELAPMLAASQ
jgi:aminopeptidase N